MGLLSSWGKLTGPREFPTATWNRYALESEYSPEATISTNAQRLKRFVVLASEKSIH